MTRTTATLTPPGAPEVDAPVARPRRPVISLERIGKTYGADDTVVHAVRSVDLSVERGDYIAIMGASGSGKSTLMNLIGCLDTQTRGTYRLDGVDVRSLDERQLAIIRNRKIGFVFQSFNLIPRTKAVDNVALPMSYAGVKAGQRRERALAALAAVGLSERADHIPTQLSGGQQQRVAIARAIVTQPVLLLADEPTGALDSVASRDVLALFDQLNAEGRTLVIITHENEVAAHAKRVVRMFDGSVVSDVRTAPLTGLPPRMAEQTGEKPDPAAPAATVANAAFAAGTHA